MKKIFHCYNSAEIILGKRFVFHRGDDMPDKPQEVQKSTKETSVTVEDTKDAANQAQETAAELNKKANSFEHHLWAMSEQELAAADPAKLAEKAKDGLKEIVAKKNLTSTSLDAATLQPFQDIIDKAYTAAEAHIDEVEKTYEARKERIANAISKIAESTGYYFYGNKLITKSMSALGAIFDTDKSKPASMQDINNAAAKLEEIEDDIALNYRAITAMGEIHDELTSPVYEGLTIAATGALKVERDQKNLKEKTGALTGDAVTAHKYIDALNSKAKANGTGDGKLFDQAKAEMEAAFKEIAKSEAISEGFYYTTPEDTKYDIQRTEEKQREDAKKPLPSIDQDDAESVMKLKNGESMPISMYEKPVVISRNEKGEYVLPNGFANEDVNVVLHEARMQAWKEKYPEEENPQNPS